MKPLATYNFTRHCATRYVFQSCTGSDIIPLPTWVKGENKGKRYIQFEDNKKKPRKGRRHFKYVFSLGKSKVATEKIKKGSSERLTGVNFETTYPNKTFGDTRNIGRNDAILIEFSETRQDLTMWLFENQADNAEDLFRKWTAGVLCMAADRLPVQKESPLTMQGA